MFSHHYGLKKEESPIMMPHFSRKAMECDLYINPPRFDQVASFSNLMTSRQKKTPGGAGFKEIGYEKNFMERFKTSTVKEVVPYKPIFQKPSTARPPPTHETTSILGRPPPEPPQPPKIPSYYETYFPKPKPFQLHEDLLEMLRMEEARKAPGGPQMKYRHETFDQFHTRMLTRHDGSKIVPRSFSRFGAIKDPVTPPNFPPPPWITLTDEERAKVEEETRTGNALHAFNLKERLEAALKRNPAFIFPMSKRPKVKKLEVLFPPSKNWVMEPIKTSIKPPKSILKNRDNVIIIPYYETYEPNPILKNRSPSDNKQATPAPTTHALKARPELFLTETGRRSPERTRPPFGGVRIASLQASRRKMLENHDKNLMPPANLVDKITRVQMDIAGGNAMTKYRISDIRDPYAPKPKHGGRYDKYSFKFSKFHY